MNHYDVAIHPDELRYWLMIGGAIIAGWLFVKAFDRLSEANRPDYLKRLGIGILIISTFIPIYSILNPDQTFSIHRSLPFHFCAINFWLIGFNCFFKSRKLFVYTFFMALIGGLYSLLTPLLTVGDAPYVLLHYVIVHTGLFVVPIVMIRVYGMRLSKYDWIRSYLFSAAISTIMIFINGYLNIYLDNPDGIIANYMFVWEAPPVENPFLMPSLGWPYFLIPAHFALILHILVLNIAYRFLNRDSNEVGVRIWQ